MEQVALGTFEEEGGPLQAQSHLPTTGAELVAINEQRNNVRFIHHTSQDYI